MPARISTGIDVAYNLAAPDGTTPRRRWWIVGLSPIFGVEEVRFTVYGGMWHGICVAWFQDMFFFFCGCQVIQEDMEDTHFPRPAQDRSLFMPAMDFLLLLDPHMTLYMLLVWNWIINDNHNVRFVTYFVVGLLILCPRWWLPGYITSSSSSIFLAFTI